MKGRKKNFIIDDKFTRSKPLPGVSPFKLNESLVLGEGFARRAGSGPVETDEAMSALDKGKRRKTYITPKPKTTDTSIGTVDDDKDGIPDYLQDPNKESNEENNNNVGIGPVLPPKNN
jgi:hypothetical protein